MKTQSATHTPGPWNTDGENIFYCPTNNHDSIDSDLHIAKVYVPTDSEGPEQEGLANARLIASAPELLEALKAIKARMNGVFDDPSLMKYGALSNTSVDVNRIAEEAIAKASGK